MLTQRQKEFMEDLKAERSEDLKIIKIFRPFLLSKTLNLKVDIDFASSLKASTIFSALILEPISMLTLASTKNFFLKNYPPF